MKRLVVLISGRGRNLQAIIEAVRSGQLNAEIALVISNRADAAGLELAQQAGIATQVIRHIDFPTREAFDEQLLAVIAPLAPDIVALAGFMRILTPGFIRAFSGRLLNIHPSLLPLYPGLDTHARALANGDTEHGASVHLVTEQLDGGPVLAQGRLRLRQGDDAPQLAARVLQEIEIHLYPRVLESVLAGELDLAATPPRYRNQALLNPLQLTDKACLAFAS